jgi:hypothetical protein
MYLRIRSNYAIIHLWENPHSKNERGNKMGLDMYLSARKYVSGYSFSSEDEQKEYADILAVSGLSKSDFSGESPSAELKITIGYWRKANAIHQWFVKNVQDGIDECQKAYVEREKLQELKDACDAVLANATKADELLPTTSGFFFGGTEYDEWYHESVKHTSELLGSILSNPKFADFDFEYQSSW